AFADQFRANPRRANEMDAQLLRDDVMLLRRLGRGGQAESRVQQCRRNSAVHDLPDAQMLIFQDDSQASGSISDLQRLHSNRVQERKRSLTVGVDELLGQTLARVEFHGASSDEGQSEHDRCGRMDSSVFGPMPGTRWTSSIAVKGP